MSTEPGSIQVALAQKTEGAGSRTAEDVLFAHAMNLEVHDHFEEASRAFEQMIAILHHRGGKLARLRESVRVARFWSTHVSESGPNTLEAFERVQASRKAISQLGLSVPPVVTAKIDFEILTMSLYWTDLKMVGTELESTEAVLLLSRPSLGTRSTIALAEQKLNRFKGNDERALESAREFASIMDQAASIGSEAVLSADRLLTNEFLWEGRLDDAAKQLEKSARFAKSDAALDRIAIYRADLALRRGDARLAAELLPQIRDQSLYSSLLYTGIYGNVLCNAGQTTRGLTVMREGIRRDSAVGTYVNDPDVAYERSLVGLCALKAQSRSLAVQCALDARRAFDDQKIVAPRYLAPLIQLEQALRIDAIHGPRHKEAQPAAITTDGSC